MAKRTEYQIAIDGALTKHLTREDRIYDYLAECTRRLGEEFAENPNAFFYVKGSVALARYLRISGIDDERVEEYCARSDWDTQLVVNPLLPAKEWFIEFKACQDRVIEHLKRFEDELVGLFAPMLPSGADATPEAVGIPGDRVQKNALAKKLRSDLGVVFARQFLDTSHEAGFDDDQGDNYWDLQWDHIWALDAPETQKNILEMDIQGHNQATLTWAMVHPGQVLANLSSIIGTDELNALREETAGKASTTWERLTKASNRYVRRLVRYINDVDNQNTVKDQNAKDYLQEQVSNSLWDVTFIRSLPTEAITGSINAMPHEQEVMIHLWLQLKQTRDAEKRYTDAYLADRGNLEKESLADRAQEGVRVRETAFARYLIQYLEKYEAVKEFLYNWCLTWLDTNPERLAEFADAHYDEVRSRLPDRRVARLRRAEDGIDKEFDLYHEEPGPEEMAESDKMAVEKFAPFTLVEQQKGGRRIGSILENMTIRDFYLYRLMIRCQISNKDQSETNDQEIRLLPDAPDGVEFDIFKQQFKFRAELLDVSVPRNDSLEAAEQWAHVKAQIELDEDNVPLPKGGYFIDEYMLLFREVLDSTSSSAHKLSKRLWRACLVAEAFVAELTRAGELEWRLGFALRYYPNLRNILATGSPGAVVLMRICEQLIESHDLVYNDKLRADTVVIMDAFVPKLEALLTVPLTDNSFYELMDVYAHLGRVIYLHLFTLARYRRQHIPDEQLLERAKAVVETIGQTFQEHNLPCRCAVVEDFAIMLEPDLPNSLKETLPLEKVKIVVYTTADGAGILQHLGEIVGKQAFPKTLGQQPVWDIAGDEDKHTVYVRLEQRSGPHNDKPGMAVIMTVEGIVDDTPANWLAPTHVRDLGGIIGHYRRTLPTYTEFYVQTQKKRVLRQLETALTTY